MAKKKVIRKLVAILATDMVGFSRLMEKDEAGTVARQKAHRKRLIDPKIASHNGRIVKSTGDGLLVEFAASLTGWASMLATSLSRTTTYSATA